MQSIPVGYRTESYSGSGVRDIAEIIEFEMSVLCNKDIPEYVLKHYAHRLTQDARRDIEAILVEDCCDEYPFVGDGHGHGVGDRGDLHGLIQAIIAAVAGPDVNIRYGLWLSTYEAVKDLYARGTDDVIDAYPTSIYIFSDLWPDGRLYGYAEEPQKQNP